MAKSINLVGRKYHNLLVANKSTQRAADGSILWECVCDCGNMKLVSTNALNTGTVKSCGCLNSKDDLVGEKFGRLTVVSKIGYIANQHTTKWKCICECGKETIVSSGALKSGATVSCGCYASERKSQRSKTHGIGNENRLYRIWSGMKTRCYSEKNRNYGRYGKRGIVVADNWRNNFLEFQKWALENGYNDNLSIDRIDNDGPYSPENCRWTTTAKQNNNRRTNMTILYNGTNHTISEWSRITGINQATLAQRKRNGWSDNDCIETPVRKNLRKDE